MPTYWPERLVYFTRAVVLQMPAVVGDPLVPAAHVPAVYGKSASVGIPLATMNGIAYSRTPPPHELEKLLGEFCVVHSRTYSSDRSGVVTTP